MDMIEYKDPNECTLTCFKLECGHAFHTKCIINVLNHTSHKCPVCNKYKTNDDKIELEGKIRKLLLEISKEPEIRSIKEEYNIAKQEYKDSLFECKKAMLLLFKEQVSKLKILEKRSYFLSCIRTLKNKVKEKAIEKTNKHFGAMVFSQEFFRRSARFESIFLGLGRNYWIINRMKHPRLFLRLDSIKNKTK
jgi:hypothetical protein